MSASRSLEDLKNRLKKNYSEKPHIDRLFYPEHPLPLDSCFLHLALIDDKAKKKDDDQSTEHATSAAVQKTDQFRSSEREHFLHQYEQIEHSQHKLEIKDLLRECEQQHKRIYIEGAAGAGKSTLSRYIVYQWSLNKSPWNHYQWVFYIRLRELVNSKYTAQKATLFDILERECFRLGEINELTKEEKNELKNYLCQYPRKVLFLLDGFDELQLSVDYICTLWDSIINSDCDVLITSRPGMQQHKQKLKINLDLAVLGFNDQQIKKYIQNFFDRRYTPNVDPANAKACFDHLRANPNLWSLAHIPIQLELLCSLWGKELQKQEISLTELYSLMVIRLLKRYQQLHLVQKGEQLAYAEIDSLLLTQDYQAHFQYMEYLAFLGMRDKKIVLQENYINEAYQALTQTPQSTTQFYKELKGIGLLKRDHHGQHAEFAHLTFQEFFAAHYIARSIRACCEGSVERRREELSSEALLQFFREKKWDSYYEVMWWFVAGLLADLPVDQSIEWNAYKHHQSQSSSMNLSVLRQPLQCVQIFFDLLLQEPRHSLSFQEVILLTRCLDEAGVPEITQKEPICTHVSQWYSFYWRNSYSMKSYALEITSLRLIEQVLKSSRRVLAENFCSITRELCENQDFSSKTVTNTLKRLNYAAPIVLKKLNENLQNDDIRVRVGAATMLVELNQQNDAMVSTLVSGLRDEISYIKANAADALGKLGQTNKIIINALMTTLRDKDSYVGDKAAEALSKLCQANDSVMNDLLVALKDGDNYVRKRAIYALGRSCLINEKIVNALVTVLKDADYDVRNSATFALVCLGQVNELQINELIVNNLIAAIKDHLMYIMDIERLSILDKASELVMNILVGVLKEANHNVVRSFAAAALGRMGLVNELVLSTLAVALNESDPVYSAAAKALGQLGQANELVVNALVSVLMKNPKYSPRNAIAIDTLGQLGQNSELAVRALVVALGYDDRYKRINAAKALGQLRKTSQLVVNALLNTLRDKDTDVIFCAALALGKLGQASDLVVDVLLTALRDGNVYGKSNAAYALGQLGQASDSVVNALIVALRNEDKSVRRNAIEALGKLGQASDVVVSALVAALRDEDEDVRSNAAKALGELGQASDTVVKALLAALRDEDEDVRSNAAKALGELGQASDTVVKALLAALRDGDEDVRSNAAKALGILDQVSDAVVNALLVVFKSANIIVRQKIINALAQSGQTSDIVSDALLTTLNDQDYNLRLVSIITLVQLDFPRLLDILFSDQPPRILPSRLLLSSQDLIESYAISQIHQANKPQTEVAVERNMILSKLNKLYSNFREAEHNNHLLRTMQFESFFEKLNIWMNNFLDLIKCVTEDNLLLLGRINDESNLLQEECRAEIARIEVLKVTGESKKRVKQTKNRIKQFLQTIITYFEEQLSAKEKLHRDITLILFQQSLTNLNKRINLVENFIAPTLFVSYAWGVEEHEQLVHRIAEDLQQAGIEVWLDDWHNRNAGQYIDYFTDKIEEVDEVLLVGSKHLLAKYKEGRKEYEGNQSKRSKKPTGADQAIQLDLNASSKVHTGYIINQELDEVSVKIRSKPGSIHPILLDGEMYECLPPRYRNLVPINFTEYSEEKNYRECLFRLIESLLPAYQTEIEEEHIHLEEEIIHGEKKINLTEAQAKEHLATISKGKTEAKGNRYQAIFTHMVGQTQTTTNAGADQEGISFSGITQEQVSVAVGRDAESPTSTGIGSVHQTASATTDNLQPYRIGLKREELIKPLLTGLLPENIQLGKALAEGDCFFDSMAQVLNQLEGSDAYSVKSLRLLCDEYTRDSSNTWVVDALRKDKDDLNQYLVRVQFTASEMEANEQQGLNLGPAVWGRAGIEGRMICDKLNVQLHLIELHDGAIREEQGHLITEQLIDKNGSRSIESMKKEGYEVSNLVHLLVSGLHFVPLIYQSIQNVSLPSVTQLNKHSPDAVRNDRRASSTGHDISPLQQHGHFRTKMQGSTSTHMQNSQKEKGKMPIDGDKSDSSLDSVASSHDSWSI